MKVAKEKAQFKKRLKGFAKTLDAGVSATDRQWAVKGFIDAFRNIYTISADTKIVSKILEIHLFPKLLEFVTNTGYRIVLADHQNYYPDMTFVSAKNESIKFAVRRFENDLSTAQVSDILQWFYSRLSWQLFQRTGQEKEYSVSV